MREENVVGTPVSQPPAAKQRVGREWDEKNGLTIPAGYAVSSRSHVVIDCVGGLLPHVDWVLVEHLKLSHWRPSLKIQNARF